MATETQGATATGPKDNLPAIREFLSSKGIDKKFKELLGKKAPGFITSVLQVVASSDKLKHADIQSIYGAAAAAAVLDLPINNNLGFAYIVPYNEKNELGKYVQIAQFQMGYKGYIQLAQRTGQYKTISAAPIYEGQLISENPLTGYVFDFTAKKSEKVIGYASYFALVNGFEKVWYMSIEQMTAHGSKYSKTFNHKNGRWALDFDGMAMKTVLKLNISKYGPLSIEMQKALEFDQAKITDAETMDVEYMDNTEAEIVIEHDELRALFDAKLDLLTPDEQNHAERILKNQEVNSYNKLYEFLESKKIQENEHND